jgi:branched-chain amino acid transport system permease protein
MSLNLINGFTGQFSLGHAGFMAVGAYSSAYLSTLIPPFVGPLQFIYFGLLALVGGLFAAGAGFLVGLPSLRLRGDYLAIVTLGFGEIIRVVLLNTPAVGGARGMYGIQGPTDWTFGSITFSKFFFGYTHALFWVLACFFFIHRVIRSSHGRAFLSVREDEIAAEAMGINTTQAKVRAFVLSSFFAGVAGSIFAHYSNYLNPSTFSFMRSVDAVIMVVLGGMGSLSGSLMAAGIITILPEALRPLQEATGVDLRMVIYSLCLILLMILRPKGLMGNKELGKFWKARRKNESPT